MSHVAKTDFAKVHLTLARRALGIPVKLPDAEQPEELFPDDDDLDAAKERHPSGGGDEAA